MVIFRNKPWRGGEVLTTYAVKVDERNDSFTTSDAILKQAPLQTPLTAAAAMTRFNF